jgi:hypothetical protein
MAHLCESEPSKRCASGLFALALRGVLGSNDLGEVLPDEAKDGDDRGNGENDADPPVPGFHAGKKHGLIVATVGRPYEANPRIIGGKTERPPRFIG